MKAMEVELVASFPDILHLEQATAALKGQGVLDVRVSNTWPALSASSARSSLFSVSVLVERSRYRLAEDTILRFQGAFLPGTIPSLIFP